MSEKSCSILILNYNGKSLLKECLPSVIEAVNYDGIDHEIIVVDNASTDGSCEFIRTYYPRVKLIPQTTNKYLVAYNESVKKAKYNHVILLNNDLRVKKDFIQHLLRHFDKEDIFAVGSKLYSWDRITLQATRRTVSFSKFSLDSKYTNNSDKCSYTFFAEGGAAAFDKNKFLKIGGFDPLFKPYYVEDTDLSYNAWKRGWKVIYEPKAIAFHKGRASIGKISTEKELRIIFCRNRLLFYWKNITDKRLLLGHIMLLPYRLVAATLRTLSLYYFKAFFQAMLKIKDIYQFRKKNAKNFRFSDEKVVKIINSETF